jgi:gag-polypeptide of LTR copia-type
MVSEPMAHPSSPNSESNLNPNTSSPNLNSNMTSLTSSETLVVINTPIATKLHRNNFLAWKSQIVSALHGHDLYRFLENTTPDAHLTVAGQQLSNPASSFWRRQDQLLLTWLRSSLTDTILAQVVSCTTSAELWQLLQQTFSATSRARRAELRRSFQNVSKGGQSCSDYCQKIRSIADELAFIGSPVPDEDLVLHVLGGLGSDYNAFVVSANSKENMSFSELQSMLMSHESLLQSQMGSTSSLPSLSPAAYFTAPRSGPKNSYQRPHKSNFNFRSRGPHPTGSPLLPTPHKNYSHRPISNFSPRPTAPGVQPLIPEQASNPDRHVIYQICDKRGQNAKNLLV